MHITEMIKEHLAHSGVSVARLAARLSITRAGLSKALNKQHIDTALLDRICSETAVNFYELYGKKQSWVHRDTIGIISKTPIVYLTCQDSNYVELLEEIRELNKEIRRLRADRNE